MVIVDANDEDTASRIIEQLVGNEHRDALRDHERVEGWKQLEIEGGREEGNGDSLTCPTERVPGSVAN